MTTPTKRSAVHLEPKKIIKKKKRNEKPQRTCVCVANTIVSSPWQVDLLRFNLDLIALQRRERERGGGGGGGGRETDRQTETERWGGGGGDAG